MKPINKSIVRDTPPIEQPEGSPRYVLNGCLTNRVGAITTDRGMEVFTTLPSNSIVMGSIRIPNNDQILFVKDGTSTDKIFRLTDKTYYLVLSYNLQLSVEAQVYGDFIINNKNQVVILWTDNLNPPRFLNIDEVPQVSNLNQLNLFPIINSPAHITAVAISSSGGNLKTGAISLGLAYIDEDGTETGMFYLSQPVYIRANTDSEIIGTDGGIQTRRSVSISLSNIDTSFSSIRLYAFHRENSINLIPREIKDVSIIGTSMTINYTGDEPYIERTRDELLVSKAYYERVKHIKVKDNTVYLANTVGRKDIGAQKYVNNIVVEASLNNNAATMYFGSEQGSYANGALSFSFKTFIRDEVYALYIAFTLDNGQESFAYHIPGRAALSLTDGSGLTERSTYDQWAAAGTSQYVPLGGAEARSTYGGSSRIFAGNDTSIITSGGSNRGMSYWENADEYYPDTDDWDVFNVVGGVGVQVGSLRALNVRHHKMPSNRNSNFKAFQNGQNASTGRILNVNLSNIRLPNDIQQKVTGYKIYYAKRDFANASVLCQGTFNFMVNRYRDHGSNDWVNQMYHFGSNKMLVSGVGDISYNSIRFNSFDYLFSRFAPQLVTHLKVDSQFNFTTNPAGVYNYVRMMCPTNAAAVSATISTPTESTAIYKRVSNAVHIPADSVVQASGFPRDNIVNTQSESCLAILVASSFLGGAYGTEVVSALNGPLVHALPLTTLYTVKRNMYNELDGQELVFSGEFAAKVGGVIPQTISGVQGDSFLSDYAFRSTNQFRILDGNTNEYIKIGYFIPVESATNIRLRLKGAGEGGVIFNPLISTFQDINGPWISRINVDNFISYNRDYSYLESSKSPIPKPPQFEEEDHFITRVHKSGRQVPESRTQNYRDFLLGDYIDLPKDKGELMFLSVFNDKLCMHFERGYREAFTSQVLETDQDTVAIKSSDVFSIEPKELISTDYGYAGSQNVMSCTSTPYGMFFVDRATGKIFVRGNNLDEVSSYGVFNFMFNSLRSTLLEQIESKDGRFAAYDNPSNPDGIGVITYYDAEFRRVLFTMLDYEFLNPSLFWGEDTVQAYNKGNYTAGNIITKNGKLYVLSLFNPEEPVLEGSVSVLQSSALIGVPISLQDATIFRPKHWTIAYYPELKGFGSFHSFYPYHAIWTNDRVLSLTRNNVSIWRHNKGSVLSYYNQVQPMIIEAVFNEAAAETKIAESVEWLTEAFYGEREVIETFTSVAVYNAKQGTGNINILGTDKGIRYVNRQWQFNLLRDLYNKMGSMFGTTTYIGLRNFSNNFDPSMKWYKKKLMADKYHILRLTYASNSPKELTLYGAEIKQVKHDR